MGSHEVRAPVDEAEARRVIHAVLRDLTAFERMLDEGRFVRGPLHIGAEQELFLVDEVCRPAPCAVQILEELTGPFTTELATYNLETNLDPVRLGPDALDELGAALGDAVGRVRTTARARGCGVVLAGILPTLEDEDVRVSNMTPADRYSGMNDALARWRGEAFTIVLRGLDDLVTTNASVMLESCNTSFQLHLQVDPDDFARQYNWMQAITGPVLAAAVNSPMLLGQRLWQETRIALFEQSVDGRTVGERARGLRNRVGFGTGWVERSPVELLREDVARYRPILVRELGGDPLEALDRGELPPLSALALFNGTVWRWNRPCFGVSGDTAHLRIENRVLPSGPSVVDAVANAALLYGLMIELPETLGDAPDHLRFADAHRNFVMAAQHGLDGCTTWLGGRTVPTASLLLEELLPTAAAGLSRLGVADPERLLAPVEGRARTGQTGARWILDALEALDDLPERARHRHLTEAMIEHQVADRPVHTWEALRASHVQRAPARVRDVMSTDVYTVRPSDPVAMAAAVLTWRNVHHVPVEDAAGKLVGMVTEGAVRDADPTTPVRDIAVPAHPSVTPDTPLSEVTRRLAEAGSDAAVVVAEDRLIGVVTEHDLPIL